MEGPSPAIVAAPERHGHDQITRSDIRDELQAVAERLQAFAETVLEKHLSALASRVQEDVRSDMEQLLQQHLRSGARPLFTAPSAPGVLRSARQVGWEESPLKGEGFTANSHRGLASAGDFGGVRPMVRSLREAVLGNDCLLRGSADSQVGEKGANDDGSWQTRAQRLNRNIWFERITSLFIFLNTVWAGVLTDYQARNEQNNPPLGAVILELCFLVVFSAEMAVRLFAWRLDFFRFEIRGKWNKHIYWNMLDLSIVSLQLVVAIVWPFRRSLGTVVGKAGVLRVLRLFRLLRIVRLIKVLRVVGELRMIVYGIWRSMSLFFWAIVALFMVNYVFSVYFTDLVLTAKYEGSVSARDVDQHFGSLGSTMVSLFMAVNGGRNWGDLTDVLSERTDFWVMGPFLFYMAFTLYAVLNVISGVFLETAMESAKEEKELFVVCNARMVFQAVDHNGNGMITWPELEETLSHADVRRFFDAVGIDISEARALFALLDSSDDGHISADEFIEGCLRVRGPSKSLDLLVLQKEVAQLFESHVRLRRPARPRSKTATAALKLASTPGAPPPSTAVRSFADDEAQRPAAAAATAPTLADAP